MANNMNFDLDRRCLDILQINIYMITIFCFSNMLIDHMDNTNTYSINSDQAYSY